MTMTHNALSIVELRNAMALAIARKVVAGERVPDWAVEDFAAADADVGASRPGSAFGL